MPTRRAGYGVVHDHKQDRRSLILCRGSMQQIPLSEALVWQDTIPGIGAEEDAAGTLF